MQNEIERPSGIPPGTWSRAVGLVRELAPTAPFYWPVWRAVFRRCLMRISGGADAAVFFALFSVYERAGGKGSTFEPWPVPASGVAQDAAGAIGSTSEPSTAGTPGAGQEGPRGATP